MLNRVRSRVFGATAVAAAVIAASMLGAAPASAAIVDVYDSIPNPLPPNVSSLGFQAQQTSEFGQRELVSVPGGSLDSIEVGFSTWACESGGWTAGCVTTPGSTYQHPITVTVYSVVAGAPGPVLATTTEIVDVPFRPSSNPTDCGTGATTWYSPATESCFNGMLFTWEFNLSSAAAVLPAEVIVSVAFNTNTWGANPMGFSGPWDSLNVAMRGEATMGSLADPDQMYRSFGATPVFTAETGWASTGPLMLTISTFQPDTQFAAPPPQALPNLSAQSAPPAPGLPPTGSSDGTFVVLGGTAVMLLALGGVLIVGRMRQRRAG